jgi:hypothetical protein
MPIEFACPHCQKEIRVLEARSLGTTICPACQATVPVPASAGSGHGSTASYADAWSPPSDEAATATPRAPLSKRWRATRVGLGLIYDGIALLTIATCAITGLANTWNASPLLVPDYEWVVVAAVALYCAAYAAVLLLVVGLVLATCVPSETGLGRYAVLALGCILGSIAFGIVARSQFPSTPHVNLGVTSFLWSFAFVLFGRFLRGIGRLHGAERLRRGALRWMVFVSTLLAASMAAFLLNISPPSTLAQGEPRQGLEVLATAASFACAVVATLWLLRLLRASRKAILGAESPP